MEQAFFLICCTDDKPPAEELHFRVVWKKKIFEVSFGAEQKVAKLKEHIQTLTGPRKQIHFHFNWVLLV